MTKEFKRTQERIVNVCVNVFITCHTHTPASADFSKQGQTTCIKLLMDAVKTIGEPSSGRPKGGPGRFISYKVLTIAILGFHCHAIEKKNRNHSMNEVKKLTCYR